MDYLSYLETVWHYLPYIICTYVFLTLLPKSFCRIKRFADADYEANRYKYHRCYGPDNCCHKLASNAANSSDQQQQQKQRKTVRRVYPKRQPVEAALHAPNTETVVKRQVQASAIQTQTNVNQIARMFETGSAATVTVHPSLVNVTTVAAVPQQQQQSPLRKVNRVQPTNVLPEIRMPRQDDDWEHKQRHHSTANGNVSSSQLTQLLLQQEKLDNSNDLLQQLDNYGTDDTYSQEPRRPRRAIPTTLNLHSGSVSSATPSTSSPQSSPPASPQQLTSPVLLRPQFNLKSSLEDIFAAIARNAEKNETNFLYAGCKSLSPVTSIEDILQQRRLSRPLSAYSISDLLNDESAAAAGMDEHYVENFLRTLNKT